MIVKSLKKIKNNYEVNLDDNKFIFDEEIIIKYRLVEKKEISDSLIDEIIHNNNLVLYYKKALNYALKYNKNSASIVDYLTKFELKNSEIKEIIDQLIKIKVIDDKKLILNDLYSLINKGNGKLMIINKLYKLKFNDELIDYAINNIDYELYYNALKKQYNKAKEKYKDESDDYIKDIKIKRYLYNKGYSLDDIRSLDE